ncbi:MAG: orotate phosphoribosyltransferase [Actinomycetota bacterium]
MNQLEVQDLLAKHGALMEGHFRLSSGRHSDRYVQKQKIMEYPRVAASLAHQIAERFKDPGGYNFETVVSPAVGAIGLGTLVAFDAHSRFLFTERVEDQMTFRRGQALKGNERVLVVEDIVTTGGSAAEVVETVKASGATLVGVAALVDRGSRDLPFSLTSLCKVDAADWDPAECPMCARDEPMTAPGSRGLV